MLQRTLFRSARAAAVRPATSSFFVRPAQQFQNASRQVAAQRFYATEGEAKEESAEVSEADKIKEELEAKTKEATDLKVCHFRING